MSDVEPVYDPVFEGSYWARGGNSRIRQICINRNLISLLLGDCLIVIASIFLSLFIRFDFSIPSSVISVLSIKFLAISLFIKIYSNITKNWII